MSHTPTGRKVQPPPVIEVLAHESCRQSGYAYPMDVYTRNAENFVAELELAGYLIVRRETVAPSGQLHGAEDTAARRLRAAMQAQDIEP